MADFTDKLALGTSRMNPSSMVPGAMGGNAPQRGVGTQQNGTLGGTAPYMPGGSLNRNPNASQPMATPRVENNIIGKSSPLTPEQLQEILEGRGPSGYGAVGMPYRGPGAQDSSQSDLPLSELPPELQQMLPDKKNVKNKTYKKEDFQLLSDVFKTLGDR